MASTTTPPHRVVVAWWTHHHEDDSTQIMRQFSSLSLCGKGSPIRANRVSPQLLEPDEVQLVDPLSSLPTSSDPHSPSPRIRTPRIYHSR